MPQPQPDNTNTGRIGPNLRKSGTKLSLILQQDSVYESWGSKVEQWTNVSGPRSNMLVIFLMRLNATAE